jgi:hypothetical protein
VSLISLPLLEMKNTESALKVKLISLRGDLNELTESYPSFMTNRKKRTRAVTAREEKITQIEEKIASLNNALQSVEQCHVIIISVRLVHLLSHIVYTQFNILLTQRGMSPSVRIIGGHEFDDIGDMMEKTLFGGIIKYCQQSSENTTGLCSALSCDFRDSEYYFNVRPVDNNSFLKINSPTDVTEGTLLLIRSIRPVRVCSNCTSAILTSNFVETHSEAETDSIFDEFSFGQEIFIEEPEYLFFKA